ncbi:putrescine aminotransferase [Desulfonispora thiosulfatigenes DSM 11270]|uniref:Putrescine aminotransferase n=1 Tax=Desulfonispora thiosulfatigenes DSM 11270 TaxID=656914 RepID=A0A1W1VSV4_DESTI|nr:aspartate aminotransferase family protein [Desulfonispora thiosulfatigenes]SMB96353.1 putrescine aminotransferase [Desulfonispora thiosulfatigenes DSM 11270]
MNLYDIEDALNLKEKDIKKLHNEYLNPSLVNTMKLINFDRVYEKALGSIVVDSEDKEYIDFLGGYGSLNLGHNPPSVVKAIERVKELPNILQASLGRLNAVLASNLAEITPGNLQRVFFCNSGAEAVEGALKLAKISTNKTKIIYCEGSFHGKSIGALSVTGRQKYKKPFYPLLPGCEAVPFGDITALLSKLKGGDVAAFILECIQGEGGVILPPEGYLKIVRDLCSKHNVLMIIDEVQTGFGRTGKMFACEHESVTPDIMCLAKSLGGGVMPIGAYITTENIHDKAYGSMDTAMLHTSTFGGNTMASAAGIATINELINEDICKQAHDKGKFLLTELNKLKDKYGVIKEVRGKGLLIGIELQGKNNKFLNKITKGTLNNLSEEYYASLVAGKLLNEHGIITAYTLNNPNVIRIEPALNINHEYLIKLIDALDNIFSDNQSFIKMAFSSIKNKI